MTQTWERTGPREHRVTVRSEAETTYRPSPYAHVNTLTALQNASAANWLPASLGPVCPCCGRPLDGAAQQNPVPPLPPPFGSLLGFGF
jgi:hypothetical protein